MICLSNPASIRLTTSGFSSHRISVRSVSRLNELLGLILIKPGEEDVV